MNTASNSYRMSFDRHANEDLSSEILKNPCLEVSLDLWELGEVIENDVPTDEIRSVLIESVCDKQRNIVEPYISRSRG